MLKITSEIYERYIDILHNHIRQERITDKDYISFLNYKFCEIVNRFYHRSNLKTNIQAYVGSALKKSKSEYFRIIKKWEREKPVDPHNFEQEVEFLEGKSDTCLNKTLIVEGSILDQIMLIPIITEQAGWIDLQNDLFKGMSCREISFLLLVLNSKKYETISRDFKCSIITIKRVIKTAKEKIKINALRLGYKI